MLASCLLMASLSTAAIEPAPTTYVIAIGNNAVPQDTREQLETLAFSDDDAISFAELSEHFTNDVTLLAELDLPSQRRYGKWLTRARQPTLAELERAVQRIAMRIQNTADADATVIVFFSGHGSTAKDGEPFLALADASLTRARLYERVLAPLQRARAVHLLVDACNAESVVRPRGGSGHKVRDVDGQPRTFAHKELDRALSGTTLARFPNTGAIVATTAGRSAHEWTRYERGVFTHELLSGMRGAADVNGDLRVEYSELHAFLSAANREIDDPKAKVEVVVEPPRNNVRAPLIDLSRLVNVAWLDGDAAAAWGHFFLEDGRGVRVADAHLEQRARFRMALPIDSPVFIRNAGGEVLVQAKAGETINAGDLRFSQGTTKARGAVAFELQRGLFAAAYGPTYYRGFVDAKGDVPVSFEVNAALTPPAKAERSKAPAVALWAIAGGATVAAAILGGLALAAAEAYNRTDLQAPAMQARDRYNAMMIGFYTTVPVAAAAAIVGFAVYPWKASVAITPTATGVSASVVGRF
ncbi:MAG: caspase family protein [Deltaproteobacteria bacterium]|nr:caspase family protein [Deltaproteobacteria bacterium]